MNQDPYLKIEDTPDNPMSQRRLTHPAFGIVQLNRWHGNTKDRLFQSNVECGTGMSLEIMEAELLQDGSRDHVFAKKHLVKVNLSPAQFADLLTNMNTQGVPCTIVFNAANEEGLRGVPRCPVMETPMSRVETEFDQAIKDLEIIDATVGLKIREALEKIPAKHRVLITEAIQGIARKVKDHLPYIREKFEEATAKTLEHAKAEISAFTTVKLEALGLQSLVDQAPTLPDYKSHKTLENKP